MSLATTVRIRHSRPELLLGDVDSAQSANFDLDLLLELGLTDQQQQLPGPGWVHEERVGQVRVLKKEETNCGEIGSLKF